MTSLNFQDMQAVTNFASERLQSPQGWITTGIHIINLNTPVQELPAVRDHNLCLAAKRTEQLIDALEEGLSMEVPVSYMRAEHSNMFHVLLLISNNDFHSSKILAARILAEKYARTADFEIKFAFAIESENRMNNTMKFGGYKLMHKSNSCNCVQQN